MVCQSCSNPAVDLAPFGRWTLRDEAAQRRSPSRYSSQSEIGEIFKWQVVVLK